MRSKKESCLDAYRKDSSVSGLIFVECKAESKAHLTFFSKFSGNVPFWTPVFTEEANIGKNGPGKEKEGDGKTPLGTFTVTGAFGIHENPGTALPYLHIDKSTFACSEKGPYYNRILSLAENHPDLKGEWMKEYNPEYNLGIIINYNHDCIYPKGSHIFVHCKGEKDYTEGCIAIEETHMQLLLQKLKTGDKICIINTENNLEKKR